MRLLVLASGSGTLLQAVIDWINHQRPDIQIVAVGSDQPEAPALRRARDANIPTFELPLSLASSRQDWDRRLAQITSDLDVDLVVCAGFMKILGADMLTGPPIINTHPALLPSFPGKQAVRDALHHGVKVTGTTCHVVDAGVDTGPIIAQRAVTINDADDEATLHERIKTEERLMLCEVLGALADGRPLPNLGPVRR